MTDTEQQGFVPPLNAEEQILKAYNAVAAAFNSVMDKVGTTLDGKPIGIPIRENVSFQPRLDRNFNGYGTPYYEIETVEKPAEPFKLTSANLNSKDGKRPNIDNKKLSSRKEPHLLRLPEDVSLSDGIRMNDLFPSRDLLTTVMDIALSKVEAPTMRSFLTPVYGTAGSDNLSFFIANRMGEAKVTGRGVGTEETVEQLKLTLRRVTKPVIRLKMGIDITRDSLLAAKTVSQHTNIALNYVALSVKSVWDHMKIAEDEKAYKGDGDLKGLLDDSLYTTTAKDYGKSNKVEPASGKAWDKQSTSPSDILQDMTKAMKEFQVFGTGRFVPKVMVVPAELIPKLVYQVYTAGPHRSVMSVLREATEIITGTPLTVIGTNFLNVENTNEVKAGTNGSVLLIDNNPMNITFGLGEDFIALPPDLRAGDYEQVFTLAMAGALIAQPKAIVKIDKVLTP